MDCRHFTNKLVYVTRQGKIELVCAIYTSSHSTYLTFCVRYTSSVNCINFHTVGCTSCKSFIDKIMFRHKVMKLPNSKSGQILSALKPYFLVPGQKYGGKA